MASINKNAAPKYQNQESSSEEPEWLAKLTDQPQVFVHRFMELEDQEII